MATAMPSPHSLVSTRPILRAVTRKKRPSFSPQKWISGLTPEQPKQRSQSHSASASRSTLQMELQDFNPALRNPKTAALDFEEFSFIDDHGQFRRIQSFWLGLLCEYLVEYYDAVSISEVLPYLVVWCLEKVPPPSERPFMIAGLVAIWLVEGKDKYPWDIELGDWGRGENKRWIVLEQDLLDDLKAFVIPRAQTLSAIMSQHFPEALAISYINCRIVVEFKESDVEQYRKRLDDLPCLIAGTEVILRYHNGPIHGKELRRLKEPDPTKFDGQYDDTDYVKAQGCFYPGAMLSSKNDTMISAGILIQKQDKIGVTVAIHCWDKQIGSNLELGHEDYTVKQGNWADGTAVGVVTERIGFSDIGVAEVDKTFSNRFLDLNGSASSLLHSDDVRSVNESFWIDSFVTGPQHLASAGRRIYKAEKRGKDLFGDPSTLPGPGVYILLEQGIYATSRPEINTYPNVREGVCGAAIIRARGDEFLSSTRTRAKGKKVTPQSGTPTSEGVLPEISTPEQKTMSDKDTNSVTPLRKRLPAEETTGEVAGFMHWSDVQSVYTDGRLLCFADTVDGLMEDGWKVVLATEKRKADAAGLDGDSDPLVVKSPAKK